MFRNSLLRLLFVLDLLCFTCLLAAEDSVVFDQDIGLVVNVSTSGSNRSKDDSFAGMLDRALEKEFTENDEQSDGQLISQLLCLLDPVFIPGLIDLIQFDTVGYKIR